MEVVSEETPLINSIRDVTNVNNNTSNYTWNVVRGSLNTLVHTLIGVNVFVNLCFAFNSFPPNPFQLHVGLSVIGYQMLMSHGILSLASYNGWSSSLTHHHRRRSHWVLQLVGSVLAAAGSIIMMRQKTVNFTSTHGKLALAALIFTGVSLLNGVLSLYRIGVRRVVTPTVYKLSHLVLGTVAFTLSSVCLIYGLLKRSFREWSSLEFSYLMIAVTCVYTFIIICRPCYIVGKKLYRFAKYKTC